MEWRRLEERARSRIVAALWIVGATIVGWPTHSYVAERGLDPSWRLGATFAHLQGHRYGDDIVFNYGPLGFVTSPLIGGGRWFFLGVAGMALLVLSFATATFLAARIHGASTTAAGVVTAGLLLLTPTEAPLIEFVVLSLAGLIGVGVWHRWTHGSATWALTAALAATLMVVKVSAGPVVLFVVLCACVADSRPLRSLSSAMLSFVVTLIAWWVVLGQALSDLGPWLRGAVSIAVGHTAAMAVGESGALWQYSSLLVVLGAGGLVAGGRLRRLASSEGWADRADRVRAGACALMLVAVTWFFVKQGFVRRDGHVRVFFLAAAWCAAVHVAGRGPMQFAALRSTGRVARSGRGVAVAAGVIVLSSVCALVASTSAYLVNLNPARPATALADTATYVVSASRRTDAADRANADARAAYGVPQKALDLIGSASVHIDPHEVTLAWVYGLDWQPTSTMQRYLGYTPALDEANAERLLAPDGPHFVLRTGDGHLDGRYGLAESPAYVDALLCNFSSVYADEGWQLFERGPARCGPMVEIESERLEAGEEVRLPVVDAGSVALYVGIDYHTGLASRLAATLMKPPSSPGMSLDGRSFRMIEATAATPAVIGVPLKSGWQAPMIPVATPVRTLSVDRPATVTFFTRTISS